mmetsp:Transcript_51348/g.144696  ORF Transcript_51348/g.144696 Transcript_51348/m.144696 type:complete len:262 (-) Transcript_51348:1589-2374(-)
MAAFWKTSNSAWASDHRACLQHRPAYHSSSDRYRAHVAWLLQASSQRSEPRRRETAATPPSGSFTTRARSVSTNSGRTTRSSVRRAKSSAVRGRCSSSVRPSRRCSPANASGTNVAPVSALSRRTIQKTMRHSSTTVSSAGFAAARTPARPTQGCSSSAASLSSRCRARRASTTSNLNASRGKWWQKTSMHLSSTSTSSAWSGAEPLPSPSLTSPSFRMSFANSSERASSLSCEMWQAISSTYSPLTLRRRHEFEASLTRS